MNTSRLRSGVLGAGMLLCIISCGLLSQSCVPRRMQPSYLPEIPSHSYVPEFYDCGATTCVRMAAEDYYALVLELKAACLALGNSAEDCQIAY